MSSLLTDIPGHLLAEIFLRLPTPEDLAHASAACVSFRRLLPPKLPPPPRTLNPRSPRVRQFPSRSAAASTRARSPRARRHRRLLLLLHLLRLLLPLESGGHLRRSRPPDHNLRKDQRHPVFKDLAVCDPLHRRYVLLPPIPHDLAASHEHPFPIVTDARCKAFLVPLSEEEVAAGETTFRVILMANCKTSLATFVFSSSTGQWQAAASKGWSDLALGDRYIAGMLWVYPSILRRHYAYGCFYWDLVKYGSKKLLLLATTKMEFSIADLPLGEWNKASLAIVEAGEGRLGMFALHGETTSDLIYTVARNKGESPSQWQVEKTISLDSGYKYRIRDATQRYLLFTRVDASSLEDRLTGYFSMDRKTLQIQRVYEKQDYFKHETYAYINFPPSLLSSRRI